MNNMQSDVKGATKLPFCDSARFSVIMTKMREIRKYSTLSKKTAFVNENVNKNSIIHFDGHTRSHDGNLTVTSSF